MKPFHILLSMLGLGVLLACKKSGYETKEGSVYYKKHRIPDADYGSFQILSDVFAKDKQRAYYRGLLLTNADGASFNALDEHYGKDNTAVFYGDNYLDFKLFETSRKDRIIQIHDADADSFGVIIGEYAQEYARDKWRCYYKGIGFAVTDAASFEPLDYGFGTDKTAGYFERKPIPGSSGRSFVALSTNFAKDHQHVYYAWTRLDGPATPGVRIVKAAEPQTFINIGAYHSVDRNHAYYKDEPLAGADPITFKKWDESYFDYATDTTHVYFQNNLIQGADRASFALLADNYARDSRSIFYEHKQLKPCDVTSFNVLKSGYANDGKRIFFEGDVLRGADAESFSLVGNETDRDAADKNQAYYGGQRVKSGH